MINTNEIRLGNYYQDRGGKWLRVDFIEYIEKGFSTKFGQKMFLENQEVPPEPLLTLPKAVQLVLH